MNKRSPVTAPPADPRSRICRSAWIKVLTVAALLGGMVFTSPSVCAQEDKRTLEHEMGFYYTVKKGDTLWDLSQRFADSPWIWPELWKENDQIPNPHLIYPGERIRIYHRDWIDRVAHQKPAPAPEPVETASTKEAAPAAVETVPPLKPEFVYSQIDAVGFIRKTAARALGTIFKARNDKAFYGTGEVVYIRQDSDQGLAAGRQYTIYRTLDPLRFPDSKRVYGVQHLLVGILTVTDLQPRYAIGTIDKAFRAIYLGDKLIPYEPRDPKITLEPAVPGLNGVLFASEDRNALIGEYMTGFIDKGSDAGVAVGQEYLLYYQDSEKVDALDKDPILLAPVNFGTLLVLHTEAESSTVLVTSSKDSIAPFTKFRAPGQ